MELYHDLWGHDVIKLLSAQEHVLIATRGAHIARRNRMEIRHSPGEKKANGGRDLPRGLLRPWSFGVEEQLAAGSG